MRYTIRYRVPWYPTLREKREGSNNVLQGRKFMSTATSTIPGRFGAYGGRYVPETLMAALEELEQAYAEAQADPVFHAELDLLLRDFAGRPTPLYLAARLTSQLGEQKSTSNAKTCCTRAPTRSTTVSARGCSRAAWANIE